MTIQTIKNKIYSLLFKAPQPFPPEFNTAPAFTPHPTKILALLLHLCDGDKELVLWVARWVAYPLRNGGAKMSTAIVMYGEQGSGASLFFKYIVRKIYGLDGNVIGWNQLNHQSFNDWAVEKDFILVDDQLNYLVTSAEMTLIKSLISSDVITINQKGREQRSVYNAMNFVFLTGDINPMPLALDDRRFLIIETPVKKPQEFYADVMQDVTEDGIQNFLDWLLYDLDMGDFNTRTPAYKTLPDSLPAKAA